MIRIDAQYEGLSTKGFTGLLAPIGDSFSAFGQETLGPLAEMATKKMNQMADSLLSAAEQYGLAEAEAHERIESSAEGGGFNAV